MNLLFSLKPECILQKLQVQQLLYIAKILYYFSESVSDETDQCSYMVCENGGTCHTGYFWETCKCPEGFSGYRCQRKFHLFVFLVQCLKYQSIGNQGLRLLQS